MGSRPSDAGLLKNDESGFQDCLYDLLNHGRAFKVSGKQWMPERNYLLQFEDRILAGKPAHASSLRLQYIHPFSQANLRRQRRSTFRHWLRWIYRSFGGTPKQSVGAITAQIGDFSLRPDEDYFGDGKDWYRTGGLLAAYKVNDDLTLTAGASMMTGMADPKQRIPGGNPRFEDPA